MKHLPGISAPWIRERGRGREPITRLRREEEGPDLTEYGLWLSLVALATITSMSKLANAIKTVFSTAAANLTTS